MAKDTLWFPHDYHSRDNEKIKELIDEYGSLGYGEYWIIAEMLHEDDTNRIELSERFYRVRAKTARMSIDTYKVFIEDCAGKFQLMIIQDGFLTMDRVERNKEKRTILKNGRSEAGKVGAAKRWGKNGNCHKKEGKNMANAIKTIANANSKMANDAKRREEDSNTPSIEGDINIPPTDWIKEKRDKLTKMIAPYVNKYGKELCNDFWYYWGQPHKTLKQLKWEGEQYFDVDARLRTFKSNANKAA